MERRYCQPAGLRDDSIDPVRMTVAKRRDAEPRNHVEIARPARVVHARSTPSLDHKIGRGRDSPRAASSKSRDDPGQTPCVALRVSHPRLA